MKGSSWILKFIIICNIVELVNAGTAADCPPGWGYLNVCLAGQCPDASQTNNIQYYCFRAADVCCSPPPQQNQLPNNNNPNNNNNRCVDGATNCILFFGACRTNLYYNCMATHCRRTCGFCNG